MKGIAIVGATGGLGEAVARRIARRAPVTIGYCRNEEKARTIATAIRNAGGRADVAQVDVRESASVKAFFEQAGAQWGGLTAIASVTGPAIPLCPMLEVTEADFKRIYETDVYGSFHVLRHGASLLAAGGGGAMVLFLTTAVLRTLENDAMSGCPKSAVAALLKQMARELGPKNVRFNGVAPGVIDAGIVHSSFVIDAVAKGVIEDCLRKTPLGRMGKPAEVASLVDYLTSDDAAYISGQVIAIDGAYSA